LTTTTQKRKMSKSAWFLIFLLIVAVVAVTVLAAIGSISLQFLADILVGYMAAGASSWMMAAVLLVLPFFGGILFFYIIKAYFIGDKTKGVAMGAGYSPTPAYPSAAQKDTETVIS